MYWLGVVWGNKIDQRIMLLVACKRHNYAFLAGFFEEMLVWFLSSSFKNGRIVALISVLYIWTHGKVDWWAWNNTTNVQGLLS